MTLLVAILAVAALALWAFKYFIIGCILLAAAMLFALADIMERNR